MTRLQVKFAEPEVVGPAVFRLIDVVQEAAPDAQMVSVAVLFHLMCRVAGVPPAKMLKASVKVADRLSKENPHVQAVMDFLSHEWYDIDEAHATAREMLKVTELEAVPLTNEEE